MSRLLTVAVLATACVSSAQAADPPDTKTLCFYDSKVYSIGSRLTFEGKPHVCQIQDGHAVWKSRFDQDE